MDLRAAPRRCLTEDQVLAFVEGRLDPELVAAVDAHAGTCAECGEWVLQALQICEGLAASGVREPRCPGFEPGALVSGRYLIQRRLGKGGMGDVYAARDLELGRCVALKTVRATGCDDPRANRRLFAEHELACRIEHENVCRTYQVGMLPCTDPAGADLYFISMDLIDGECLGHRLRRGPLPVPVVVALARELLRGLSAIHRARVIHRDIKSHNVMIQETPDGLRATIIDFGLAVPMDATGASYVLGARDRSGAFTFEGSPLYMAPEQFHDGSITPAADIFSAGVVLFEALTGALPFCRPRGDAATLGRPAEVAPSVRELVAAPLVLDAFIARCLNPEPERRFPDATRAATAWEAWSRLQTSDSELQVSGLDR